MPNGVHQNRFEKASRHSPFGTTLYRPVPGEGPVPARLMLIGERPGAEEARRGRPFVGPAGQVLNTCLNAANLDRSQIYITNLVKNFREYEKPTAADIEEGMGELLAEIEDVQPEFIGLLGTFAVEALLQRDRADLERTHGVPVLYENSLWLQRPAIAIPMYHPAAGIWSPDAMANVLDDILRLGQLMDGELHVRRDEYEGKEDYQRTNNSAITAPVVAIDTEGSRAKPWCLTWSQIPGWSRLSKVGIPVHSKKVYLHNSLHDLGVLRKMGTPLNDDQFVDTMVLAYLLCIEPQGLKALAYRHCGMHQDDYSDLIREPNRIKAVTYFDQIIKDEWPDPEPYIVLKAGAPKIKKPWNISRLVGRALTDLSTGKVDKNGDPPDLRARWHKWDDSVKQPVIDMLGDMPEATLDDVDPAKAEWYANRDSDATLRIGPILEQRIKDMGLEEASRVDHAILPMIDRMQEVGIQLARPEFWDNIERQCEAQMGRAKYQVYKMTGAEINPASGDQVAELLYGQLKLTPPKMTDSGDRGSVNGLCLESLLSEAPVVQHIMDYNEANKIKGTYCLPLRKLCQIGDGRSRSTFRITRTTTGRLSMADPPLHQIPILTELGRQLRAGFIAPDGYVLGDWDLDQIEMRLMAHESKDPELCRLFNEERDIHSETAAKIFSVSINNIDGKKDVRRTVAKHAGFGIINGITEHGLWNYLILNRCKRPDGQPWTLDDCVHLLESWFGIYKGVKKFQNQCIAETQSTGLARESISGRIIYLPAVWSPIKQVRESAERMSYVMHTQGGAASLIKKAMANMWGEMKVMAGEVEPLLWVHDEILTQVVDSDSTRTYTDTMMQWALTETVKLRVPVKASGGYAHNWLEAH